MAEQPPMDDRLTALLELASSLVGDKGPLKVEDRAFPFDCSGYVGAVFYYVGEELLPRDPGPLSQGTSGTEIIYRRLQVRGELVDREPAAGDVVFFDNTWDRNGDGLVNDEFTHIALVEKVLPGGTLQLLHLGGSGIGRVRMTLSRPDEYRDSRTGEILNHKLRRPNRSDPEGTPALTAQLFRGFGRVLSAP